MRKDFICERTVAKFFLLASWFLWGTFLWGAASAHAEWPPLKYPGKADLPTSETLEKWLQGKEVIQVWFLGPLAEPSQLQKSLAIKGDSRTDFILGAGTGRGAGGSFVEIRMKVTPENVRRLLALQAELAPRGYTLDAKGAKVWSYQGDAKTREEARKLVPAVVAAWEHAIQQAVPGAAITAEPRGKNPVFLGGFGYHLPGTDLSGSLRIDNMDAHPYWEFADRPKQIAHFPQLGLIVTHYSRPRAAMRHLEDDSSERQTIRRVFKEKLEPLLKLEPGAGTWDQPPAKRDAGRADAPPTPETLEKWLAGKELIQIWFSGPHMEPTKLRDSLTVKGDSRAAFWLTPGEGGGPGAFVDVCMKVTPENVRRLLDLQAELAPRGYNLDATSPKIKIWSYEGDAKTREQARKLVPQVLGGLQQAIKQALPGTECTTKGRRVPGLLGAFDYAVPGKDVKGFVQVHNIADHQWALAIQPDQTLHLPHLGLIVLEYYRPGQPGGLDDKSPEHQAIERAFKEQVEPLLKLEPGAAVTQGLLKTL